MPRDEQADDPLAFTQRLLSLLDEGRRTATYKLAVVLALIDCCAVHSDASGRAPDAISTRDLATRVAELYWPQVRPHETASRILRQSSQPRAIAVDSVAQLRDVAGRHGATTFEAARARVPGDVERCLDKVELTLVRMPLGKLQRPLGFVEASNDYPRFLYDDGSFHERVRKTELPLPVRLEPGVGDWLVSLGGLLRPLVELYWTREVARFNGLPQPEDSLHDFLFGVDRVSLHRFGRGLTSLHGGRCFYCGDALRPGNVQIDHFVPWSRIPNDGLTNLVPADGRCNSGKRDNYADLDLLARWAARSTADLGELAAQAQWPLRRDESLSIARGLYGHLPAGTRLWSERGVFTTLDEARRSQVLRLLVA